MRKKVVFIIVLLLFVGGLSNPVPAENTASVKTDPAPADVTKTDQTLKPMTDIHDLKSVEAAGFDPALLLYVIAGMVIAMLIGGLIYYLLKRGKNKITTVEPELLPEETAIRLLEGLSGFKTMSSRDFYFRLSAILREYIKNRFNINAPEMTTEEIFPRIERIDIDRKLQQDVKKLLSTADPIKFAGRNAAIDQMGNDLLFVKNFVKDTTPETVVAGTG